MFAHKIYIWLQAPFWKEMINGGRKHRLPIHLAELVRLTEYILNLCIFGARANEWKAVYLKLLYLRDMYSKKNYNRGVCVCECVWYVC